MECYKKVTFFWVTFWVTADEHRMFEGQLIANNDFEI